MGTYEYLKMTFGLNNAPATFQRALDIIMSGMIWQTCLAHLDDVIVFSDTPENHMKTLYETLTRWGPAGATLKAKKCQGSKTSVEHLRHVISPGDMWVHNKNLKALLKVGHPRTNTQLRSHFGMCNVYRRFDAKYARIAAPLNQLTTKAYGDMLLTSTETRAAAFTCLRDALLHPPVLALPRCGAPFTIDVDPCDTQSGCALLKEQQDGQFEPLGLYSRALQPEQRNYSATADECLGLVWAVLHIRHYLKSSQFTVRTDHECLSWINRLTTATGRLLRWRLRLAELDLEVKYKKGANQHLPDALSRVPATGLEQKELDDDIPCFLLAQAAKGTGSHNFSAPVPPPLFTAEELLRAQGADGRCQQLRAVIDSGNPTRFVLDEEGRLVRHQPTTDVMQVNISVVLCSRVMGLEHEHDDQRSTGGAADVRCHEVLLLLGVDDRRPVRLRPAVPAVRKEPAAEAMSYVPHAHVPAKRTADRSYH